MAKNLIATASATINVPRARVWDALVNPEVIKQYMFGTNVVSDWRVGSRILWKGEWQGKSYEDKGVILRFEPQRVIEYSHFSPMAGLPDVPENYHRVTVSLSDDWRNTKIVLDQDNNGTEEERDHSKANWEMMLKGLKALLEKTGAG